MRRIVKVFCFSLLFSSGTVNKKKIKGKRGSSRFLIMCWDFILPVLKCNEMPSVFLPDYQWRWLPAHGPVCCASVATLTTLGIWQGSKCSSPARKDIEANPFRERLVAGGVAMGWLHRGFLSLSFPEFSWERKKQHQLWAAVAFTVSLVWDVTLADMKLWPRCGIQPAVV